MSVTCAGADGQSASVYERSMAAFGAIMQFYDPLRSFPLWGFGDQVCACRVLYFACARAQPQCALLVCVIQNVFAMEWPCSGHSLSTLHAGEK